MSTIKFLSCSASFLARTSLSQTNKTITSGLTAAGVVNFNRNYSSSAFGQHILTYPISGELKFLAAKPSISVYELTKYSSNSFSTKPPNPLDKKSTTKPDQKAFTTTGEAYAIAEDDPIFGSASKLSGLAKFKLMYKKYWYVLVPVHVGTSISWIVGFYYLSKSGVDIPSMLEYIHLSESIIEKVRHSDMGHYAIAYLCYKIITPLRYMVSLGMTTISIKRLVLAGYIKPIPTKKEFMAMYEQKKADRAKRKENDGKNP